MIAITRQKFSSQASPKILQQIRDIAHLEGRQFQAVLEEAMEEYIKAHESGLVRKKVLSHFSDSIKKNRKLAELLAK